MTHSVIASGAKQSSAADARVAALAGDVADLSSEAQVLVQAARLRAELKTDGARLADFVEKGGGLMITASEDLDTELYNAELGRVHE